MSDDLKRPSWLSWTNLVAGIQVSVVVCALVFWAATKSNQADSTAAAMITLNARFDRVFEKLDTLTILAEQMREVQGEIDGAKGAYASLDVRLRAIEQNNAALHNDIQTKRDR